MDTPKRLTRKFFEDQGRLGGRSRSAAKIEAVRKNILFAIAARRQKRLEKNNENNT